MSRIRAAAPVAVPEETRVQIEKDAKAKVKSPLKVLGEQADAITSTVSPQYAALRHGSTPAAMSRKFAETLPAPEAPGGSVFGDQSENPIRGGMVDALETYGFGPRIGYSPADKYAPKTKAVAGMAVDLAKAAATGQAGGAVNLIPRLVQGAGIGAGLQMGRQGAEDPMGTVTAALMGGAGGAMMPSTVMQGAGAVGTDALMSTAETVRQDPARAERLASGRGTPEDWASVKFDAVTNLVPSLGGNAAAVFGAKTTQNRTRENAWRSNARIDDMEARLLPEIQDEQAAFDRERMVADQEDRGMRELFDLREAQGAEQNQRMDAEAMSDAEFDMLMRRAQIEEPTMAPELATPDRLMEQQLNRPLPTLRPRNPADLMGPIEPDPSMYAPRAPEEPTPELLTLEDMMLGKRASLSPPSPEMMRRGQLPLPMERVQTRVPPGGRPMPEMGRDVQRPQIESDFMGSPRPQIVPEFSARSPEIAPTPEAAPKPVEPVAAKVGPAPKATPKKAAVKVADAGIAAANETGGPMRPIVEQEFNDVLAQIDAAIKNADTGKLNIHEPVIISIPDDGKFRLSNHKGAPTVESLTDFRQRMVKEKKALIEGVPPPRGPSVASQNVTSRSNLAGGISRFPFKMTSPKHGESILANLGRDYANGQANRLDIKVGAKKGGEPDYSGLAKALFKEQQAAPKVSTSTGRAGGKRRGGAGGSLPTPDDLYQAVVEKMRRLRGPVSQPTLNPNQTTVAFDPPPDAPPSVVSAMMRARLNFLKDTLDSNAYIKHVNAALGPAGAAREDAYQAARMAQTSYQRQEEFKRRGFILPDGTTIGPDGGLSGAYGASSGLGNSVVADHLTDFDYYDTARRVLDVAQNHTNPELRAKAMNGTLVRDMTAEQAAHIVAQTEAKYPGFRAASDVRSEFMDAFLQYLVFQGKLSPEAYQRIKAASRFYTPLKRAGIHGDADPIAMELNRAGVVDTENPVKAMHGSDKLPIIPQTEAIERMVASGVGAADRNRVYSDLYTKAEENPENAWFRPLSDQDRAATIDRLGREWWDSIPTNERPNLSSADKKAMIRQFGEQRLSEMYANPVPLGDRYLVGGHVNGKHTMAAVDPDLWKTLVNMKPETRSFVEKLFAPLRIGTALLKGNITAWPSFMIDNVIRQASTNATASQLPLWKRTPLSSVSDMITKTMNPSQKAEFMRRLYSAYGPVGANEGFTSPTDIRDQTVIDYALRQAKKPWPAKESVRRKYAPKIHESTIDNLFALHRFMESFAEQFGRVPEFHGVWEREIKGGADPESALRTASAAAKDVGLDFLRAGEKTRVSNRYIPFLNANVQGAAQTARTWRNPRNLAKAAIAMSIPSAGSILSIYFADDDKKRWEMWKRMTDDMKNRFWMYPNPRWDRNDPESHPFIRIQKQNGMLGFGPNLFAAPTEATLQFMLDDPNWQRRIPGIATMDKANKSALVWDMMVNSIGLLGRAVEAGPYDRNSFTGRQFTKDYEKHVKPSQRFTAYSSPAMVRWAQALDRGTDGAVDMDPDKLEHLTHAIGGTTTKELLGGIDKYALDDPAAQVNRQRTPIIGNLFSDEPTGLNTMDGERFMDEWENVRVALETSNAIGKRDAKEYDAFAAKNARALDRYKYAERTMKTISAGYKQSAALMVEQQPTTGKYAKLSEDEWIAKKKSELLRIGREMADATAQYWKDVGNEAVPAP